MITRYALSDRITVCFDTHPIDPSNGFDVTIEASGHAQGDGGQVTLTDAEWFTLVDQARRIRALAK